MLVKGYNEPVYVHDCKQCVYLGNYEHHGVFFDLYVCSHKDKIIDTLVARHGNEGPEYCSGVVFIKTHPQIKKAYELALAKGYMLKEEEAHYGK